ncbi:hypothetical protein [Mycobacteroides chelonae]|nr:hypothetical protein [Mycobacteroides chelonae]QQG86594.1 hypothetical protein HBA99_04570 [Mycobacteroides chelonae]QQG91411.1 hypothetical protein HBA97_04570 [Mycobacteroides chelonae]
MNKESPASEAAAALAAGRDVEALRLAESAVAARSTDALAWRVIAYAYANQGSQHLAIESAMNAVTYAPSEPISYYTYAWVLSNACKYRIAHDAVDQALRLDPSFVDALRLRAAIRHRLVDNERHAPEVADGNEG